MNLATVEMKAFLPALDFEKSKQFYLALGFEIPCSRTPARPAVWLASSGRTQRIEWRA